MSFWDNFNLSDGDGGFNFFGDGGLFSSTPAAQTVYLPGTPHPDDLSIFDDSATLQKFNLDNKAGLQAGGLNVDAAGNATLNKAFDATKQPGAIIPNAYSILPDSASKSVSDWLSNLGDIFKTGAVAVVVVLGLVLVIEVVKR